MKKLARRLRILIAVITCVLAALYFCGVISVFPQVGPSLLRAVATGAAGAIVAASCFLALTFLFGRFYCAALCPLGILQDFIGWLARKRNKTQKNVIVLRYTILAITVGFVVGGWVILAKLVEPFSLFGRFFGGLVLPRYTLTLRKLGMSQWAGDDTSTSAGMTAGALTLLILIALVIWKHRIFCTAICPVGTLLGFFAKHGVFKMVVHDFNCIRCGKCATVCPAGCIDIKTKTLDNERCLRCMNCLSACPKHGIVWQRADSAPKKEQEATADPKRRGFLLVMLGTTLASFGLGRRVRPGSAKGITAQPAIYPPGAGSAGRFASTCTACHLCVTNCEGKVLQPPNAKNYFVHLDYTKGMCEFNCNACSQICPTGAIRPLSLEKKKLCRIGMAVFHPTRCIAVVDGIACGACAEHCPTGALRMELKPGALCSTPILNEDLCIGCGNCCYPCPVRPVTAITVSPVPIQVEADDPHTYFKNKAEPLPSATDDWLI